MNTTGTISDEFCHILCLVYVEQQIVIANFFKDEIIDPPNLYLKSYMGTLWALTILVVHEH